MHRAEHAPLHLGRTPAARIGGRAGEYGLLYGADDLHGAFVETIGTSTDRAIVTTLALAARRVTRTHPMRALSMVDRTGPSPARIGAYGLPGDNGHTIRRPRALACRHHRSRPNGTSCRARLVPSRCAVGDFDWTEARLRMLNQGGLLDPCSAGHLAATLDADRFGLGESG